MAIGAIGLNLVTLGRRSACFHARLERVLAPPDPPLADRSIDELVAYYRYLRTELLSHWDAPVLNDFFTMIFYGALRELTTRWCDDPDGTLQNGLLAGEGGMISTEPARRIEALAALAAPDPAFVEVLLIGSVEAIVAAARNHPTFLAEYEAYLQRFGERCADELKLESATLLDDPRPLLRAIGHMARRRPAATAENQPGQLRRAAESRVRETLAGHAARGLLFHWVLSNARARVRDRENLRFERTRVFGRVRRVFLEIGRRLHAARSLESPRDIFYLQVDEIFAFVEGRAVSTDLKALVAIRRVEFAGYAAAPPPDARFETEGPLYGASGFCGSGADAGSTDSGTEHRGIGCCPGILRGPVRVVRDPAAASLEPGSILVAERTDPGWIVIFPSAAGLIVERGSVLSHSAIVARELGIPAIVSVPGVTTWLKDGDWVEMDGRTGLIRKVAA
jgi:pyruvate,water dikinase